MLSPLNETDGSRVFGCCCRSAKTCYFIMEVLFWVLSVRASCKWGALSGWQSMAEGQPWELKGGSARMNLISCVILVEKKKKKASLFCLTSRAEADNVFLEGEKKSGQPPSPPQHSTGRRRMRFSSPALRELPPAPGAEHRGQAMSRNILPALSEQKRWSYDFLLLLSV